VRRSQSHIEAEKRGKETEVLKKGPGKQKSAQKVNNEVEKEASTVRGP
jgi:hypothetical protein